MLGLGFEQFANLAVSRITIRRENRISKGRLDAWQGVAIDRFVYELKWISGDQRFPHTPVPELVAACIEGEPAETGGAFVRDDRLDDVAGLNGREVVLRVPFLLIGFAHRVQDARFECLEHGGAVGEELHADLVEVCLTAHEGHVLPPIVGIALQRNEASRFEIVDHVRGRRDRDQVNSAFREVAAFPLGFFQNRTQPHDQGQFIVLFIERKLNGAFAGLFGAFDLVPCRVVARMPYGAEGLVGPEHVFNGDRRAVRESCCRIQSEFDPGAVFGHLDRFGQKSVECERFTVGAPEKRLVCKEAKLPGNTAFQDMRVQGIEAADLSLNNSTTFWGIGIDVGQGHKIRWKGRVAIHSYAVFRLGCGGGRTEHHADRRCFEIVHPHFGDNPSAPLVL